MTQTPAEIHSDLEPLAWLLGRWQGNGHGDYPSIEAFDFGQEVVFAHDGRPFLHYFSRAWLVDADGAKIKESALETGFLRAQPGGEVELVLAHHTGFAEIWYGRVDGTRLEIATDMVARTQTAKDYTGAYRLYGLVEGDLVYAHDMAAMGQPLQSHTWARLKPA